MYYHYLSVRLKNRHKWRTFDVVVPAKNEISNIRKIRIVPLAKVFHLKPKAVLCNICQAIKTNWLFDYVFI